jgi:putative membrane protein
VFRKLLTIYGQILLSGVFATLICTLLYFNDGDAFHSPILFPVFGFVVGLAITFRMQSSYNRWWEGRTQWDKLSAVSRSCARTIWIHVPESDIDHTKSVKVSAINCIHTFAIALKHHLRGVRDWDSCVDLRELLKDIPGYSYDAINHPLTLTMHLSSFIERFRHISGAPIDTQVLTHLLLHVETFTGILSACERLLRTPVPLGYNIAISRIVWIFIFALPSQLWRELRWLSIFVTLVTAYALFALAEVGLEIENVSATKAA